MIKQLSSSIEIKKKTETRLEMLVPSSFPIRKIPLFYLVLDKCNRRKWTFKEICNYIGRNWAVRKGSPVAPAVNEGNRALEKGDP